MGRGRAGGVLAARWRCVIRHGADRGSYSVELAILAPAVLMLVFACIQTGLWWHAREVALTAAKRGVESGRTLDSSPAQGAAAARSFVARFGGSVRDPAVTDAGSSATTVRIDVSGTVITLVPGWDLHIDQHADGPRERWMP
ncbi:TadE/TadG family type IV pilus assembly protein [Streptantibioticus parmotrematis]|uniref:TadE/TadG family type IV pilus assembly protein n=1 Tax=Streptantibioticus parmotrematis TaxID=2873249 RepID=UPI0027E0CEAC|nr:pilus assembly protein [Streptantibioticus parmotrematis]